MLKKINKTPIHCGISVLSFSLVLIMMAFCTSAQAIQINVVFEGLMTGNSLPAGNPFEGYDSVLMRLSITYESTTPDSTGGSIPNRAAYYAASSVNLTVLDPSSNAIYSASGDGSNARFITVNDDPIEYAPGEFYNYDSLSFLDTSPATSDGGTLTGPDIMDMPFWMISLLGSDFDGMALGSEALPTSFSPDVDWDRFQMAFMWRYTDEHEESNRSIISDQLTATTTVVQTPIPEPGTLLLICAGLAGLVGKYRWKNSKPPKAKQV